jgi:ribonuclease P protein component
MSLTFPPEVRLRSRSEFTAVQQRGRRVSTRYLTLLALPNALNRDRLGIIASKRIGGAVVRNRAKRRLRDLFRHRDPGRPGQPCQGYDLVVIARSELPLAPFDALRTEFVSAVDRATRRNPR